MLQLEPDTRNQARQAADGQGLLQVTTPRGCVRIALHGLTHQPRVDGLCSLQQWLSNIFSHAWGNDWDLMIQSCVCPQDAIKNKHYMLGRLKSSLSADG